jgi:hypothetical protein
MLVVCDVATEFKPRSKEKNVIKMWIGIMGKVFFGGTVAGFWLILEVVVR